MSITISHCSVCGEGTLEGHPPLVVCEECFSEFHVHCAIDLEKGEDCEEVSSVHCPKCQGSFMEPWDEALFEGYCAALTAATVRHLDRSILEPLFQRSNASHATLDLPTIRSIDDEAVEMLLQRGYKLRACITLNRLVHLIEPPNAGV